MLNAKSRYRLSPSQRTALRGDILDCLEPIGVLAKRHNVNPQTVSVYAQQLGIKLPRTKGGEFWTQDRALTMDETEERRIHLEALRSGKTSGRVWAEMNGLTYWENRGRVIVGERT